MLVGRCVYKMLGENSLGKCDLSSHFHLYVLMRGFVYIYFFFGWSNSHPTCVSKNECSKMEILLSQTMKCFFVVVVVLFWCWRLITKATSITRSVFFFFFLLLYFWAFAQIGSDFEMWHMIQFMMTKRNWCMKYGNVALQMRSNKGARARALSVGSGI